MNSNKKGGSKKLVPIIWASSAGTMIEWYDFYIFGSLAPVISEKFFPQENPTAALLSTLATFAAGFVVRPFGALFFGRLGDIAGRKYTFMLTLILMGISTFLIGCIPDYETIGFMAPFIVLILRLLQGLALGGEYGGAATYVAEHCPASSRGYWTSWIQTTATAGLFLSLIVIMTTKSLMTGEAFQEWGWRIPFWLSVIMVAVSYLIRQNMSESPSFTRIKEEGKTSANPIKESLGNRFNFKFVLLALLGATMGQGVIWYTGHYYAMHFLKTDCQVDALQVEEIMTIAFLAGTPFFVVFGWLSDRIGRKPIMLTGMLAAMLLYFPIYEKMHDTTSLNHRVADISLSKKSEVRSVSTKNMRDTIVVTTITSHFTDGAKSSRKVTEILSPTIENASGTIRTQIQNTLPKADFYTLILLVFIQVLFVTMVYGPIAAFLVEMFPVRIRYTSMSLPYHVGNGIFGGLMPAVAAYLTTSAKGTGTEPLQADWYMQGLWYPVIISGVCFVIGLIYIDGTDKRIDD
jgi:MFS family permease